MKPLLVLILALSVVLISSCGPQKPLLAEKVLFTEKNETNYYLINTFSHSSENQGESMRGLLVSEVNNTKHSISVFTSITKPSSFVSSVVMIDSLVTYSRERFPLLFESGRSDSTLPNLQWKMSRTKIKATQSTPYENEEKMNYLIHFNKQLPYSIHQVCTIPEIYSTSPFKSSLKTAFTKSNNQTVQTNIHIFKNAGTLLNQYRGEEMVWLDLQIDKQFFSCFFKIKKGEPTYVFFARKDTTTLKTKNIEIAVEDQGTWKSKESGKEYSLAFTIKYPEDSLDFYTHPFMKKQEIFMKQGSFWMGEIEVYDNQRGTRVGLGNMYIFK